MIPWMNGTKKEQANGLGSIFLLNGRSIRYPHDGDKLDKLCDVTAEEVMMTVLVDSSFMNGSAVNNNYLLTVNRQFAKIE